MNFDTLLNILLAKIEAGVSERQALFQVVMSLRLRSMETERLLAFLTWSLERHRMFRMDVPKPMSQNLILTDCLSGSLSLALLSPRT